MSYFGSWSLPKYVQVAYKVVWWFILCRYITSPIDIVYKQTNEGLTHCSFASVRSARRTGAATYLWWELSSLRNLTLTTMSVMVMVCYGNGYYGGDYHNVSSTQNCGYCNRQLWECKSVGRDWIWWTQNSRLQDSVVVHKSGRPLNIHKNDRGYTGREPPFQWKMVAAKSSKEHCLKSRTSTTTATDRQHFQW